MAKFKIRVTIKAECTYEVEMDESTEAKAEDAATLIWREKVPEDFQVEKGYITNWELETEQLTAICPDCGIEHAILHDDLPVCYCGQFGHNPYTGSPENPKGRALLHPHLIVNGVCTPEPWWWDDNEYCAACGAKIEAEEKANG
jgi:predicted RNA-binding Zn-ribbon protein involved in translation (DUF1610 family)